MKQPIAHFPSTPIARMLGLEVPIMRVQDPTIKQTKGEDPKWYIKPYIDCIDKNGNLDRKQQRIYLGRCSEVGKRDAITKKTEVMGKINRSQFTIQSQVKFGEFLDTFLREYVEGENLSDNTQMSYVYLIRKYIRPAFGDKAFGEIDTRSLDALFKQMATNKAGYCLRGLVKRLMAKLFNQAFRWGVYKGDNPTRFASIGKDNRIKKFQQLGQEKLTKLLDIMPPELRRICEMQLYLTLSISEVMGLQWKHIDFVNGIVAVEQAKARNGNVSCTKAQSRVRQLPLGELVIDLAKVFPGGKCEEEFVFHVITSSGKKRDTVVEVRRLLINAAKDAGVYFKGFGFHQFRREAITQYGESMGTLQAQRMAGHSRANMTFRYTMGDMQLQAQAVRELQGKIRGRVIEFKRESA